jgi:hypothetical protein
MEILKTIDWDLIIEKTIFLLFAYAYYKLILKMYCTYFLNDFEKKYCKKITNQYFYFICLFFYGLILTLVFPIILSGGAFISSETTWLFNYFILILIFTALFCFKKAFLMMDEYNKTHWL